MIGFLRETRAGATTLAAAAVAIMSVMGVALVSDHLWLVSKRDLLKSASSAASLAATIKLRELSGQTPTPSDADIEAALQPLAERYGRQSLGCLQPRRDQCQAAKEEGIEIFTVTAMSPGHVSSTLGQELTASPPPPRTPSSTIATRTSCAMPSPTSRHPCRRCG